uniref:Uncharacterized protein n=1 Tax=Mycena chlorophos TaxID=658473 RepID=A0ABQ0LMG3_MYCCL|nr:predicted protein [Mycena chlorophos]
MPQAAQKLQVPKGCFYRNSFGDSRRQQLPLSSAREWGLEDMARICYAKAVAEDGSRFCLRFIFNATVAVEDHYSNNALHYVRLLKDAEFHSRHLQSAAGLFTPLHYGMWMMKTEGWAGVVLFSLTQWCGLSWSSLLGSRLDTMENRVLIGRTFELLHDAGIEFDGRFGVPTQLRHVLLDVEDAAVRPEAVAKGGARCYIVGLGDVAATHRCKRRMPILPIGPRVPWRSCGCEELDGVRCLLDFSEAPKGPTSVDEMIQWHDSYSERHPEYPNSTVLIAQRHRFFPEYKAVYPGVTVSLKDDSEALVLSDADGPVDPTTPMDAYTRIQLATKMLGRFKRYSSNARRAPAASRKHSASSSSSLGSQGLPVNREVITV